MINTYSLFHARKRQVRTTCQEAGSELSESQNGTIAIYIICLLATQCYGKRTLLAIQCYGKRTFNVMGKRVQTVKNNFACYTVL